MRPHIVLVLIASLLDGGAAIAHVTASPDMAKSGSYFTTNFTVPHGCAGAATVAVRIKLPEGVGDVKPQQKPGWTVDIVTRKLDVASRDAHGSTITEAVDEVAWRGGKLPDNLYDTFGLLMKLPDKPGATLYFPTVQECEQGVHRWIEIPAAGQQWHDLDQPAPFVKLTP
ncbi:MAG TPA: YcnI family protein [Stellaceae bacterium]|nr:YcnI family protein [Stellaceae bacterium]